MKHTRSPSHAKKQWRNSKQWQLLLEDTTLTRKLHKLCKLQKKIVPTFTASGCTYPAIAECVTVGWNTFDRTSESGLG